MDLVSIDHGSIGSHCSDSAVGAAGELDLLWLEFSVNREMVNSVRAECHLMSVQRVILHAQEAAQRIVDREIREGRL